jgi:hypothetical protein
MFSACASRLVTEPGVFAEFDADRVDRCPALPAHIRSCFISKGVSALFRFHHQIPSGFARPALEQLAIIVFHFDAGQKK